MDRSDDGLAVLSPMDMFRHPHFAPALGVVAGVLLLIGCAATTSEDRRAFTVFGAIVGLLALILGLSLMEHV